MDREITLQEKSGMVSSDDPVAVFFYLLAKDYLSPGKIEEIVTKMQSVLPGQVMFNNGWLGQYAKNLSETVTSLSANITTSGGSFDLGSVSLPVQTNNIVSTSDHFDLNEIKVEIEREDAEDQELEDFNASFEELRGAMSEDEFVQAKKDALEYLDGNKNK